MAVLAPLRFTWPPGELSTSVRIVQSPEDIDPGADLLVVDSSVESLWGSRLPGSGSRVVVQGGEPCKDVDHLSELWKAFHHAGLNRESTVCVVGGGAVCDLGAMAASTWMRGVRLELVPTTLLCMVDACLGGKTALNLHGAKNQVGTVHPARLVTVCEGFLRTLPRRELLSGTAEAVKTAVIGDRGVIGHLRDGRYSEAVLGCLSVKGRIVEQDLYEKGPRKLLNLGHTLGHALEMLLDISHGEAVALGMPAAARMGGEEGFALELEETLEALGLPVRLPAPVSVRDVMPLISRDKKTGNAGRTWVVPHGWEDCRLLVIPPEGEEGLLARVLEMMRS